MEILEEYEKRLDDVLNLNVQESIEKERHLIQMINAMMSKKPDPEVSFEIEGRLPLYLRGHLIRATCMSRRCLLLFDGMI